jgi:hypothetical protein
MFLVVGADINDGSCEEVLLKVSLALICEGNS